MDLRCGRLIGTTACAVVVAALMPATGMAAQLIGRDATNVHLRVDRQGVALITYRSGGQEWHVLARGAINALPRSRARPQVSFELDYSGGQKFFGKPVWQAFAGSCGRYTGPNLYGMVSSCKAPDGSYWALQSWQQPLPDFGFSPWTAQQKSSWLELSHWTGPLAQLDIWQAYAQQHHNAIFGTYTYKGNPVYGYGTTRYGVPTDDYGRLVYLDTYGSSYGSGWRRENSFVSRGPAGEFCYAFIARNPRIGGYALPPSLPQGATRGPATGSQYRIIAEGPGVTPLVSWSGNALAAYHASAPADVVRDIRNRERLTAIAKNNPCLKGQYTDPRARTALASLQDDFKHGLSSVWARPTTTGGGTVGTGSAGLTFSVPAGQSSSASLLSASTRWTTLSPAWVDLGPVGVPKGMTFSLLLVRTVVSYQGWYGAQIGDGQLRVVRRTYVAPDPSQPFDLQPKDEVFASLPYDPQAMRWLFFWMAPGGTTTVNVNGHSFPVETNNVDVYYARSVDGAWTLAGSAPVVNAGFSLGLEVSGDGSAAGSLTIDALTR